MAIRQKETIERYVVPTLVVAARLVVGGTFLFSGFVKAVDPVGMSLKIEEYLLTFGLDYFRSFSFFLAVAFGAYEFMLGAGTIFGTYRRLTSWLLLVTMSFMTLLTLYLAVAEPIADCGCFGEAVRLTPWQSFWKNIVLLLPVLFLLRCNERVRGVYHKELQSLTVYFFLLFSVGLSLYAYYYRPLFDFRPYKRGINLREALAASPYDDPRFIYEKEGVRQEFTIDTLPVDTAWHFIDRAETPAGKADDIQNFVIYDDDEDITENILADKGYTFLLMIPSLRDTENDAIDKIDELYEYALWHGYNLYCLTASSAEEIAEWQDDTGADYPFYTMEASTIRTVVRGDPGIVLLRDGVIVQKMQAANLPEESRLTDFLERYASGAPVEYGIFRPLMTVITLFFVPLLLLLLMSKIVEAYVIRARARRVARLRKLRDALSEKIKKNPKKDTIN